ncbi:hypothetical protein MBANPS3_010520 [Mucor bainieri]
MSESKEHTLDNDKVDSKQQQQENEANDTAQDEQQPTWTPVWDDNAQAYYWWNTETNETTWINPDASPEEVAAAKAQAEAATATNSNPLDFLLDRIDNVVKKKLDGRDESTPVDGDDDNDNDTSTNTSAYYASSYTSAYPATDDPNSSTDLYTSQAHFNARTGRFTTQADVNRLNPEMLTIEARAKRQMQNYFDVDSYTEQRNAQIHNAENGRINKKKPLTRKEVEYFKKMKKEKKSKRAREWLMQLVCKQWATLADTAMFSNTIVLKNLDQALSLHTQLYNKPRMRSLVQYLYFKRGFDAFWVIEAMFNETLVPHIISIKGESIPWKFYDILLNVAQRSPALFKNMAALPKYDSRWYMYKVYHQLLLAFKETLSEIDLSAIDASRYFDLMRSYIPDFKLFTSLRTLKFNRFFDQLSDIELLLQDFVHLETLELGNEVGGSTMDKPAMDVWMEQRVTKVETLQKLVLSGHNRCDIVEHLTFKYPNVKDLVIHFDYRNPTGFDNTTMTTNFLSMDRILVAIKHISNKAISFSVSDSHRFSQMIEYLIQKGYTTLIIDDQQGYKTHKIMIAIKEL